MPVTRIRREDKVKMVMFMDLGGAFIDLRGGVWYVSTPQETAMYNTTDDLMKDINLNLDYMREAYEANGEMDDWEAARKQAEADARDWRP